MKLQLQWKDPKSRIKQLLGIKKEVRKQGNQLMIILEIISMKMLEEFMKQQLKKERRQSERIR